MTADLPVSVAKVLANAPCLNYPTHHKHSIVVQWSEHVGCIAAALADAGLVIAEEPDDRCPYCTHSAEDRARAVAAGDSCVYLLGGNGCPYAYGEELTIEDVRAITQWGRGHPVIGPLARTALLWSTKVVEMKR